MAVREMSAEELLGGKALIGVPVRAMVKGLKLRKARDFAIEAHGDQPYGDKPYVEHLSAVVRTLEDFDAGVSCLVAAWLHDVVEDTAVTIEQVRSEFGEEVANLVWAVTGEGNGDRSAHAASICKKVAALPDAAVVKLADRIANIEACEPGDKHFLRYSREHAEFEKAIKPHVSQPMWQRYLNGLEAKAELANGHGNAD